MQNAVNTLTEQIFPGVHVFEKDRNKLINENGYMGYMTSSLPLQMALYFNAFYFPFWIFISITMLVLKFAYLHPVYQVVQIVVLATAVIVEIIRLYSGYVGNLSEMIPELAGFWILTLLVQLPIQSLLLLNDGAIILPMERAANIIMLGFVIFELVACYFAIKKVSNHLATRFHLETFALGHELS